MVEQPVDRRRGQHLGMMVSKPEGWRLLVTATLRFSYAASITRSKASAASWPTGRVPMSSIKIRPARQMRAITLRTEALALETVAARDSSVNQTERRPEPMTA